MRLTTTMPALAVLVLGSILALAARPLPATEAPFEPALAAADIDLDNCASYYNGEAKPATLPVLLKSLGLDGGEERIPGWSAGRAGYEKFSRRRHRFQYRLAFRRPIEIGSVLANIPGLAALKDDAPYPGDPANPDHWQPLDDGAGEEMPVRLTTLPAGFRTRCLLFTQETEPADAASSTLSPLRVLRRRLFNLAPLAQGLASREYTEQRQRDRGKIYSVTDLLRGRGAWMSSGPDQNNQMPKKMIGPEHPEWLAMTWDEPWEIVALHLRGNLEKVGLQACQPPAAVPPLLAPDDAWRPLAVRRIAESHAGFWLLPAEPFRGNSLRLLIEAAWAGQPREKQASGVARINGLLVLTDLGSAPTPARPGDALPPPFAIRHEMPMDGMLTMALDDPAGRRVRNLVARVGRPAGGQNEPWDLRDDAGKYVEPGEYFWKTIAHKPLRLRYVTTVYPNTSLHHPENTPWFNGANGAGGWLADHATPTAVAANDDMLFLGANLPESGVGFAACDLTGRKLWGIRHFDAWTGATFLAADAGAAYAGSPRGGLDRVWRIDPHTQKERLLFSAGKQDDRLRGMRALAAGNGRLYLSVNSSQDWLANAAAAGVVDLDRCRPAYPVESKPKFRGNVQLNARQDLLRLCRLTGTPPGGYALSRIPSTRGTARRQHILLAFKEPVRIGTVVLPVPPASLCVTSLSVAKADAPYPPDPARANHWQPFPEPLRAGAWDLAAAPPDTATRALLVTFAKGVGDAMDEVMADEPLDKPWQVQLEGLRILRRRFLNAAAAAKVSVNSGTANAAGEWTAKRKTALSAADPGVYLLEWEAPRKLRGLAIKEIDGSLAEIDVHTGSGVPKLDSAAGWEKVAEYRQRRRILHLGANDANPDARYLDGLVDFGREISTRAVRLRIVEQWLDNGERGREGQRSDRGGRELDPARCAVFGVAALEYLGGEPPVDPLGAERIEALDPESGKLLAEFAIPDPGALAVAPDGTLLAVAGAQVLKLDPQTGNGAPLITDLKQPTAMAVDRGGNIYVFDAAPERRIIAVYANDGRRLREIGEPGGYQVGSWNPRRFQDVRGLAVDREDKLWAADANYFPKRISCWKTDGTFLRDYLGPTKYGGDGVLDPDDRRRLFIGPLEFEIDWETGRSRLKNLTWPSWGSGESAGIDIPGEVPVRLNGRTYLVTRAQGLDPARNRQLCGVVYLYENNRLKRAAAMGLADAFPPLKTSEMADLLGNQPLSDLQFLWTDRNGDGEVQFAECGFSPRQYGLLTQFDRDLGIQAGRFRYEVTGFLPHGAPEYKLVEYPLGDAKHVYRFGNGVFHVMRARPLTWHRPDGSVFAHYPNHGAGVGPNLTAGAYRPEQVLGQFSPAGKETAAAGDLGEFMVVTANLGSWNIWTSDGLLAGRIFREGRDPQRLPWTMPEHQRGMVMDDVNLQQEHFNGWFCRADDGKYYAVAGHNHASIVEVQGLDEFVRRKGTVVVTSADIERARQWEVARARAVQAAAGVRLMECPPRRQAIEIDGQLGDWEGVPAASFPGARCRLQYDDKNLYLAWEVKGLGPFLNRGNQWDKLFQSGAAVDLQLGTDATAESGRTRPVAGDLRLLLARTVADGFTAVLYEAVVPGTPEDKRWLAVSPTGECAFDRVRRLGQVRIAAIENRGAEGGEVSSFVVEAEVPLAEIGLRPDPARPLRCDWGVLATDQGATVVMSRNYWSNQATSTLADAPTEARLHPDLWGWLRFAEPRTDAPPALPATGKPRPGKAPASEAELDKLLGE